MPDPSAADPRDLEQLRRAAFELLAERPSVALTAHSIRSYLERDGIPATLEQVTQCCRFLAGLGHLSQMVAPFGSTLSWQITAAGTLAYERREY